MFIVYAYYMINLITFRRYQPNYCVYVIKKVHTPVKYINNSFTSTFKLSICV